MNNKKRFILLVISVVLGTSVFYLLRDNVNAEQSGSSPESNSDSYIMQTYDRIVSYGQGSDSAGDWTGDSADNDWGSLWNRINSSVTSYDEQKYQRWDDWRDGATTGQGEYTGEESAWVQTSSHGDTISVTDNGVTESLESDTVMMDTRTGLYWSDSTVNTLDNEFLWVEGEDAETTTVACNFLSAGDANQYCDNQDPNNEFVDPAEDDDVSAADFCLNLSLDVDGDGVAEDDWYLPTQKQLMQAYINGAVNNLPNAGKYFWSASEFSNNDSRAWRVGLSNGLTTFTNKTGTNNVRCIRPGN